MCSVESIQKRKTNTKLQLVYTVYLQL